MAADVPAGDEIPRVGVTLAAVERFQREVARARGARRPWLLCFGATTRGLTTDAVNKLAVAHLTGARRCAYASLLDAGDASLVGEATVFVSHAWAMPFDALVAALRDFDREQRAREPARTPYFWLDLLVNDQFAAPARPFEWWQTVFRENVRRIGHTIVVLEWERPLPLQRVWCLWEMFCAASAVAETNGVEARDGGAAAGVAPPRRAPLLELVLPPASRAALARVTSRDFVSIAAKLCCIDLNDADAFHGGSGPGSCRRIPGGCPAVAAGKPCPNDKAQILDAIERAGGFRSVTMLLREWMSGSARRMLAAESDADRRAGSSLQFYLARMQYDSGLFTEAEALLRETAEVRRRTLGANALDTLVVIDALSTVLEDQGKLDEAELLLCERIDFGADSTETLKLARNLADVLVSLGDAASVTEAALLAEEALMGLRRNLGNEHASPLIALRVRGRVLAAQGDLTAAVVALRTSFEDFRDKNDVEARKTARELAAVLRAQGDEAGAAEAEASVA